MRLNFITTKENKHWNRETLIEKQMSFVWKRKLYEILCWKVSTWSSFWIPRRLLMSKTIARERERKREIVNASFVDQYDDNRRSSKCERRSSPRSSSSSSSARWSKESGGSRLPGTLSALRREGLLWLRSQQETAVTRPRPKSPIADLRTTQRAQCTAIERQILCSTKQNPCPRTARKIRSAAVPWQKAAASEVYAFYHFYLVILLHSETVYSTCPFCQEKNAEFAQQQQLNKHFADRCPVLTRCKYCNRVPEHLWSNSHFKSHSYPFYRQ